MRERASLNNQVMNSGSEAIGRHTSLLVRYYDAVPIDVLDCLSARFNAQQPVGHQLGVVE